MIGKKQPILLEFWGKFCWKAICFALISKRHVDPIKWIKNIYQFAQLSLIDKAIGMITDDIAVNFQPVLFLVCLWMKWERLLSQEQLIKKVNLLLFLLLALY